MRRAGGELSVFFALITAIIFALFLGVLESARTEAARLRLTVAANSSIDSLFSQYRRDLWEDYRILGLEIFAHEQLTDEMEGFIEPYMGVDNWLRMDLDRIELTEAIALTEDNAEHFEKEILDYMQYGIVAQIWDMADIEIFAQGAREGPSTGNIADLYDDHAKEAAEIEKALKEIAAAAGEVEASVREGARAAGDLDGTRVIARLNDAIKQLKGIPGLIDQYESMADRLESGLKSSREELDERRSAGEISDETYGLMSEDIAEYESYILADGERRQEILSIKTKVSSDIEFFEGIIEKTQEVMDYISSYEPDDDEDDEPDEEELYRPIETALDGYEAITLAGAYGVEDEETLGKIESLKTLLSGDLLKLVLPDGAKVSTDIIELSELASHTAEDGVSEQRLSLVERVYAATYMSAVSGYFGRGVYDDESSRGDGRCEAEYILGGLGTDTDNLMKVVERLLLMRGGLNLIYLYKDSAKRAEARALATAICGVAAVTPLLSVVTFLIMSVWASAGALLDIRALLRGEKVPFMHSGDTFKLSLSGLVDMATEGIGDTANGDDAGGLTYKDYLTIFLFFDMDSDLSYRMMDIMEMNLKDLSMSRLIYSAEARVYVKTPRVFSGSGLAGISDTLSGSFDMSVSTAYSY